MKKVLALLLVMSGCATILTSGCATILLSGCATRETTSAGVQIATQSESEKVVDRYSDRIESYNGLYNTMQAAATLHNSVVSAAILDQKARLFQWDQGKFDAQKLESQEKLGKETEVFISFFTPDKKHDDLNKNPSLWKIFLDVNGRRYEGKVTKIKLQTVEVQSLYGYHNRFSTPYQLIFPISVRLVENYPSKLTLTGPVGSATLNFNPLEKP